LFACRTWLKRFLPKPRGSRSAETEARLDELDLSFGSVDIRSLVLQELELDFDDLIQLIGNIRWYATEVFEEPPPSDEQIVQVIGQLVLDGELLVGELIGLASEVKFVSISDDPRTSAEVVRDAGAAFSREETAPVVWLMRPSTSQ
jgi:hypothetical protein